MTTYVPGSLPTFASVEEMLVWAACILQELYPTTKITEDIEQPPQLVAQIFANDLAIPLDENWTYEIHPRVVLRMSIPISADWKRKLLWKAVTPIGPTATPTVYYS